MKATIGLITENIPNFPLRGGIRWFYDLFVQSSDLMLTRVPSADPTRLAYVYNSLLINDELSHTTPWNINIPAHPSPTAESSKSKLKQIIENELFIYNIDVVSSYNELLNSNSVRKIAVVIIDQSSLFNDVIANESDPFVIMARHAASTRVSNPSLSFPGFEGKYLFFNADGQSSTEYRINPFKMTAAGVYMAEGISSLADLVEPSTDVVFVFSDYVRFDESPSLLGGDPAFASGHPRYCQYAKNVVDVSLTDIANTTIHEIGHALGLEHHGLDTGVTYEEYYDSPLSHWNPIMGSTDSATVINQWNNGDYPNASNPSQDDAFIISYSADFKKIPPNHSVLFKPDKWNDFYKNSEKLNTQDKKLITRNTRLISKDDIVTVEGVTTIEGLIGFPGDSDILKIILKSGSYQISDYPNMATFNAIPEFITMQCFNIQILKSQNTEVSKQTTDLNQLKRIPDHENNSNPTEFTCSADNLPNPFPDNSKNACSAILIPEEVYESRPPLSDENAIVRPSPGVFNEARSILNLGISETCLVYIKISGDKIEGSQDFTSYGSLGKYNIIIKNNDTGSFDLDSILSEKAPPNCYATEKFTSFYPDQSLLYEDIFFTQDRSDFGSNEAYDGSSDHPHVKKFNVVINGTIKEIPILLQGKEYTDYSEIEDLTVKRLFSIRNEDGDLKIQEFVIASILDHS